jgi:hypothetical protein
LITTVVVLIVLVILWGQDWENRLLDHLGRFFLEVKQTLKVVLQALDSADVWLDLAKIVNVLPLGAVNTVSELSYLERVVFEDNFGNGFAVVVAWIKQKILLSCLIKPAIWSSRLEIFILTRLNSVGSFLAWRMSSSFITF